MKVDSKSKARIKAKLENMDIDEQSRAGHMLHLLEIRALIKTLQKKKLITSKELEIATRNEVKDMFKFIEDNKEEIKGMVEKQADKKSKKTRQDYFG